VALGSGPGGSTTSRGTVAFAKPGRMRWSYTEPEPSLVVSDGETLSLYDPTRKELQRLPVGDGYLSGAAIQFLLGEGEVLETFEVTSRACGDAEIELVLVPREPATYERLRVAIDPRSGDVLRTAIVDLLGNETQVAFQELRVNLDPPDSLFTFEPPEGVEVIDLRQTSGGTGGSPGPAGGAQP
jgi:outer membrane lipoprotein-sorting protein